MATVKNSALIPTVINHFNVYNDGNKVLGRGDEMQLPNIQMLVATIQAGLGEAEIPVMGKLQKMDEEINFKTISNDAVNMFQPGKNLNVTIRASQQSRDRDGDMSNQGIKAVVKGPCKSFDAGKIKEGEGTAPKLTMGVNFFSLDIDGTNVITLDIFNEVFVINGEDQMKDILSLC
jgi:P2 family phage contractile tail tube protein